MKKLLLWLFTVATAYQVGAGLGYSLGVSNGKRDCDWEWARMLENDMVGPGSTTRPGTAAAATKLRLTGGA